MVQMLTRGAVAALLALSLPLAARADGVIQAFKGDVQASAAGVPMAQVKQDQAIPAGTTLTTGAGSQVVVRMDDGAKVVLNENSQFKIVGFHYDQAAPEDDHEVFDLFKGALRVITGIIGHRSRDQFALRAPEMTIGVRGTDFMVAITDQAYTKVNLGAISVTNSQGTSVFGPGEVGSVASSQTLAVGIPESQLPATVSSAFSQMSSVTVGAGGAAGGAQAATGAAATGGAGVGVAVGIGAAAAAVGAAISGNNSTTTHH